MSTMEAFLALSSAEPALVLVATSTESNAPGATTGRLLPLSIPEDELFFWTSHWQLGEAESAEDIRNGRVARFQDADSAIRWLLSGS